MYIRIKCFYCKHYNSEKIQTCKSFPEGIPRELFKIYLPDDKNAIYHTKPYPGDNGIQFEPIEENT